MKEEWRDIEGLEDWYEISNLGRVKSIDHRKILKTNVNNKGYETITFTFQNKTIHKLIHRLVAQAFIPNPKKLPQVNHIDGNKLNNNVKNLEWCTGSENMKHAFRTGLRKNAKGIESVLAKEVEQYDSEGNFLKRYGSIREASRKIDITNQAIVRCLKGKSKTSGGYVWKYAERKLG